jgi:hypothetical protein
VDPADARRMAEEILARREFAPPRRNPLERALAAVGRFLARLFERIFGTVGGGGGSASLVAWLIVAAVVVGLVVLVVRGWRRRSVPAPDEDATVVTVSPRRGAASWREEAAAHAAAGRWRDAVRCRYRAIETDLADRGVLDGVPGDTTGAERRQVDARLPHVAAGFGAATDVFDRVSYGAHEPGPDAWAELDALEAALERR